MDPSDWSEATGIPQPQELVGGPTLPGPQIASDWAKCTMIFKWKALRRLEFRKLAYFLNQIWSHLDYYGAQYQSDQEIITAIADNMMEGDTANWIAQLHDKGTPKDANEFVQLLRT
ncbi:hypothetical protein E2320_019887 [Naja naja]|nr:hypothetical protein E2320_019887 [Naja naja]